jgi:hypothetical protein
MSAITTKFPQDKNKYNGGRPSLYTPKLADEICMAILNGDKGIERLCKEHPHWPSKKTIFNWLNKNKDFQRKYGSAKQIQIDFLIDKLVLPDSLKWKIIHLATRKYSYS